jgi:uncharacterized protein
MVTMREIRAAARAIAKAVHPQRIILFGSYATGEAQKHSDVDLLVLMNGRAVHDRALDIREMVDFPFPVDLLVRSPREFRERVEWGDSFLKKIEQEGKVLYEAPDARMGPKGRGRFQHRTTRAARTHRAKSR